jgi:hypothetical protein
VLKRFISPLVLALLVLVPATAAAPAETDAQPINPSCTFILGFKLLHDMIPNVVGNCTSDEYHNASNGDGLQLTAGGLLVWRKCDNWTAFTNGSTTWINGPTGLVTRPNAGPLYPFEATNCPAVAVEQPPGPGPAPPAPAPAATATPTPSAGGPSLTLRLSDRSINRGDTFTITLEATSDSGVDSIWWWATDTSDDSLRNTHTFDCNGASPCRNGWDESTDDTGTITIHGQARDRAGQSSQELTADFRVREVSATATPTPAATATVTPTPHP